MTSSSKKTLTSLYMLGAMMEEDIMSITTVGETGTKYLKQIIKEGRSMNPTNKQLAQTFDVSARRISNARRRGERLLNPSNNKMQKITPVYVQETSNVTHRFRGANFDDLSLTGQTLKSKG